MPNKITFCLFLVELDNRLGLKIIVYPSENHTAYSLYCPNIQTINLPRLLAQNLNPDFYYFTPDLNFLISLFKKQGCSNALKLRLIQARGIVLGCNLEVESTYLKFRTLKNIKSSPTNYDDVNERSLIVNSLKILGNFFLGGGSYYHTLNSALYNFCKKNINRADPEYTYVIKEAYRGGRNEIFGNPRSNETLYCFDFFGMYHSVMLEFLPSGQFKPQDYKFHSPDLSVPGFYFISAYVTGEIPVLPVFNSGLIFPAGFISGFYWFEEILLAISQNQLSNLKIHYGLEVIGWGPHMYSWAKPLWDVRLETAAGRLIVKKIINIIYGNLAWEQKSRPNLNLGSSKPAGRGWENAPPWNLSMAAAISSKARIRLYKAFLNIQSAGGRVLFCDVDSVVFALKTNQKISETNLLNTYLNPPNTVLDLEDAIFVKPQTFSLKLRSGKEITRVGGESSTQLQFNFFKTLLRGIDPSYPYIDFRLYKKRRWLEGYLDTLPLIL